jgi:hypothetical protein
MIVIISLLIVPIEGLRNCDSVHPSIPKPISKIYSYHKYRCHKRDFGNVPFCKRKSTIKENKQLKNKNQDLSNKLQEINNTTYDNYYSQHFNHNYTDNLLGLESAIDTYNDTYRIYIKNINTYNTQNELNGDMYRKLDKVNINVQQNKLDNTVNVRKYNILS